MNTLKKLKFGVAVLAALPVVAFAAFDDVTLTTDTIITANGTTTVSGSSGTVESITVNELNFNVTLAQNSTVTLDQSGAKALLSSDTSVVVSNTCSGGTSNMILKNTGSASVTTLISVLSTSCGSSSGNTVGGGGAPGSVGGGGGGGGLNIPTNSTIVKAGPAPVVVPIPQALAGSITKSLKKGSVDSEVMILQKILNADPETQIASTGIGSPGNETNLFGSLTLVALKKFQVKYGIAGPGDVGYGTLGPKTKKKLNDISLGVGLPAQSSGSVPPSASANVSGNSSVSGLPLTKSLKKGSSGEEVLTLQKILNSDPETQIASIGVGSPGNETNLFGSLTLEAVKKFQVKHGISGPDQEGYGVLGPKTRAKLNEILEMIMIPSATQPSAPAGNTQNNNDASAALQKQIQDALEKVKQLQDQIKSVSL